MWPRFGNQMLMAGLSESCEQEELARLYLWQYATDATEPLEPCRTIVMRVTPVTFVLFTRLLKLPVPDSCLFSQPGSPSPSQFCESSNILLIHLFSAYVSQGSIAVFFVFKNLDWYSEHEVSKQLQLEPASDRNKDRGRDTQNLGLDGMTSNTRL